MITDFVRTSPFASMLPSRADFFSHPFQSLRQAFHVHGLHTDAKSKEAIARRARGLEEAGKRKAYRVGHGLEEENEGLQIGPRYLALARAEKAKNGGVVVSGEGEGEGQGQEDEGGALGVSVGKAEVVIDGAAADGKGEYVDFEGRRKKPVKKWFGIWE
jgi:hypothetical protein